MTKYMIDKEKAIILGSIVTIAGVVIDGFDVYEKSKPPETQQGYTKIAYSVCKRECIELRSGKPKPSVLCPSFSFEEKEIFFVQC